jgi:uncharacterized damage-inducible protein DinB
MPQTYDLKTATGYPKLVQQMVADWLERSAEKMPGEEYGFKPDPAVRSFGQLLAHIADANYLFCSAVLGETNPSPGVEKTKSSKAEITAALREAFAYAGRAYDSLTEENKDDMVVAYGGERIRLGVLWFNAAHNLEHYGSIGVYLRLKGIVPPNTESAPKPSA